MPVNHTLPATIPPCPNIAIILPAHNEEKTVAATVKAFKQVLPNCEVVVCDNASTDQTAHIARKAGARVIHEPLKGKGNAVRRLLATVNADIYILADADQTYDAQSAPAMIKLLEQAHLDMVTGIRQHTENHSYRTGHLWGNVLFNRLFAKLFKTPTQDIFSGYRVFTRRFASILPIQSSGFEIETEMTAIASILKISTGEFPVHYAPRPTGSNSKLRTWSDGFKILKSFFRLFRHFYPAHFYGTVAGLTALLSLLLGVPVIIEFIQTGLVPRIPTAILASSLGMIAFVIFTTGIILEALARNRIEQRKLFFLASGYKE